MKYLHYESTVCCMSLSVCRVQVVFLRLAFNIPVTLIRNEVIMDGCLINEVMKG